VVTPAREKPIAPWAPTQGELVWLEFDPQAGFEQGGKRPALVLSRTGYNQRVRRAFVCPVTSKTKGYPFEVPFSTPGISGVILADHFKNVDWVARRATSTGHSVSLSTVEQVWRLVESIVDL
jgi:mRNA interferase MazF